eukprot:4195026-Ditylum_brightwellii.AAC.1
MVYGTKRAQVQTSSSTPYNSVSSYEQYERNTDNQEKFSSSPFASSKQLQTFKQMLRCKCTTGQ